MTLEDLKEYEFTEDKELIKKIEWKEVSVSNGKRPENHPGFWPLSSVHYLGELNGKKYERGQTLAEFIAITHCYD